MNLKLVVASMSILGLVSCPVFAATTTNATNNTKAKHHRHHHKMMKHHETAAEEQAEEVAEHHGMRHHKAEKESAAWERREERMEHADYKGMMMQPNAPEVCTITQETMILDGMTQNLGRAIPNPCYPGWFNRIQLSGGVNVDMGKWGNRNTKYMGENYHRVSLNDAYLNLQATVNDWVHAFASISYNTATIGDQFFSFPRDHEPEYDAAYDNNVRGAEHHTLQLEQGFATLANFNCSPFFVQVGKQFQDFSRYEIHPITETLTQVMSETLATSVKVGFIASGFSGAVWVFDDPLRKGGTRATTTNYGVSGGYDYPSDQFGFDIGAAYMYNLIGANNVAWNVGQFDFNNILLDVDTYQTRVGAVAAYADVNSGPFVLAARYTTALQRFNVNDLPKNGVVDVDAVTGIPFADASGAKPWAATVQAAYGFEAWCLNQNVYVGYQTSREAAGLLIPKYRWVAGYGVDVYKNTSLAVEWDNDHGYSAANGGSGNTTNLVTIRAAVKFG